MALLPCHSVSHASWIPSFCSSGHAVNHTSSVKTLVLFSQAGIVYLATDSVIWRQWRPWFCFVRPVLSTVQYMQSVVSWRTRSCVAPGNVYLVCTIYLCYTHSVSLKMTRECSSLSVKPTVTGKSHQTLSFFLFFFSFFTLYYPFWEINILICFNRAPVSLWILLHCRLHWGITQFAKHCIFPICIFINLPPRRNVSEMNMESNQWHTSSATTTTKIQYL